MAEPTPTPTHDGKKSSFAWEYVLLAAVGGIAVASSTLLAIQWRYAMLGRRVQSNVVSFLKRYKAVVDGNMISGGPVNTPSTMQDAVLDTVITMIHDVDDRVQKKKAEVMASATGIPAVGKKKKKRPAQVPLAPHESDPDSDAAANGEGGFPPASKNPVTRNTPFPEPPISGRSGTPVNVAPQRDSGALNGLIDRRDGDGDDYSYTPPMPH